MRGEILDFDLLKIKEQMAAVPEPQELRAREDFIEKRLRRRVRRAKIAVIEKAEVDVTPKIVDEAEPEAAKIEDQPPVENVVEKVVEKSTLTKKKTAKKKIIKQKVTPKTDE